MEIYFYEKTEKPDGGRLEIIDSAMSIKNNFMISYGELISDILNRDIDKYFKLLWNHILIEREFFNEKSYPLPYKEVLEWFINCFDKIQINEYVWFLNNVILADESSLSNIQKSVIYNWVYKCGSELYSYTVKYKPFYMDDNFNNKDFDVFAPEILQKEEGIKKAIKLFQKNNIQISNHGYYEFKSINDYFNFMLHKIIILNIKIKKCVNCNKYFYPDKRSDAIYCDNKSPQDDNLTCKEYGSQKLWYENLKNNECMKLCRNIYQSKQMLVKRNPDIEAYRTSFERFKIQSQQWKNDVKNGIKTETEFIEWLNRAKTIKS